MARQSLRHRILTAPMRRRSIDQIAALHCEQLEDRTTPALFDVQSPVSVGLINNFGCVATGDFNSDGKQDIVMTNYGLAGPGNDAAGNTILVKMGIGDGTFGGATTYTVGPTTNKQYVAFVAAKDLN